MSKSKLSLFIIFIIITNGTIMSQKKTSPEEKQNLKVVVNTTNSPYSKLKPVPITAVTMKDGFWKKRIESNTNNSILKLLELLESHGVMDNFKRLYTKTEIKRKGYLFTDSI